MLVINIQTNKQTRNDSEFKKKGDHLKLMLDIRNQAITKRTIQQKELVKYKTTDILGVHPKEHYVYVKM